MINIADKPLTLSAIEKVAYQQSKVSLSPASEKRMLGSLKLLEHWQKEKKLIYGINTGFGSLSDVKISNADRQALQLNLLRSHSVGVGESFCKSETRVIMLLRAYVLARGFSGVRPIVVTQLLSFLNKDLTPIVPKKGSVGASGDLAPLAHLARGLIGEGDLLYKGEILSAKAALKKAGLKPLTLAGREGISLINGTQVMAALSALNTVKAERLYALFNIAAGLSLEAIQGSRRAFDPDLHALRPHRGQVEVAAMLWKALHNSNIQKNHAKCERIQDSYSFRCIPQVHGSSWDTLHHVKSTIETEISAVTDNPVIIVEKNKWVSGGNFHGQYLSVAMDHLAIATTTMVNISERRIEKLLDSKFSGLPPFLIKNSGLHSGLSMAHVTASALASENKVLSHPASVDTIPTFGNKEDHVSMGVHAALKAQEVLANAEHVLAIELLAASQGIYFRRPLKSSPFMEKKLKIIRTKIKPITKDRPFSEDIKKIISLYPQLL